MPYQIGQYTTLMDKQGLPLNPPQTLDAGIRVTRGDEIVLVGATKLVEVACVAAPLTVGWADERHVQPVYGRMTKQDSLILTGNQETKDLCQRFSKALDALDHTARPGFMLGVLQCENLDDKKIFYVAIAGNNRLPLGWEGKAKEIDCIPAPNVPGGKDHLRQISGTVFRPLQAGTRVKAHIPNLPPEILRTSDWDTDLAVPVDRHGNVPGACAAQKMLQLAIKETATPRHMWEQWYDVNKGPQHNVSMESCATCQITVTRMLKR